jgi:hypothetical protein
MRIRRTLPLVVIIAALSGKLAGAASMTYAAQQVSLDSLNFYRSNVALPDLTTGGTVQLGTLAFDNTQVGLFPTPVQSVGGRFDFFVEPTNGNVVPGLSVDGQFQGSIVGPAGDPGRWYGSITGVASQVFPLPSPFSSPPLPEPLLDLINNPSRIHISTTVGLSGSLSQSFININLTIDPATVPEPSTLVVMLTTLAGVILRGKRRRVP